MTLHSLRSPELDVLFKIFSRIESASHILIWSETTSAAFGDECGISIVELPRLRAQFRCNGQRLESLDFDGLYIMLEDDEDVTNLARGVPHYLPLRNALGDRFLMVRGGLILHLLGVLTRITHVFVSLAHNNTTRMLRKKLNSRSNTGTQSQREETARSKRGILIPRVCRVMSPVANSSRWV